MADINDAIGTGIGLGVGLALTGAVLKNADYLGRPIRRKRRKKKKR